MAWRTMGSVPQSEIHRHRDVPRSASGAIGKRYRRQDEIGTPFCVTVDGQSIKDQTVTIRDRDTLEQRRIPADKMFEEVAARLRA
ncbi:MAG: hypothetical protein HZA46_05440 [Planctomycetales bacterium]|nr:hypothetical protein [Planctomycetales bacterium]